MIRIGIDLGGTNIAVGAVDDGHAIVSRVSVPTLARRPAAEVVGNMGDAVEAALAKAGLSIGDCRSMGIPAASATMPTAPLLPSRWPGRRWATTTWCSSPWAPA